MRQSALAALLGVLVLSGCSALEEKAERIVQVEGFLGGAVANEPRAALIARDTLSVGGTAADAATALYLTLSVTRPSVAGLGGGGMCLVYSRKDDKVEVLDFWPRAGTGTGAIPTAVPLALRGIYALFARYGRLNWGQIAAPVERLARFGAPTSRAFAADLAAQSATVLASPALRALYTDADGNLLSEGKRMTQVELGALLSAVRYRGPGALYVGETAQRLVRSVQEAGGTLTLQDLNDAQPIWRDPHAVAYGNEIMYYTAAPERRHPDAPVDVAAQLGSSAAEFAADAADRFGDAVGRPAPPISIGRDGFTVIDKFGNAVACETVMGRQFGTGRIASGFGMVLADASAIAVRRPTVGPMLLINMNSREFRYAAAGSGERPGDLTTLVRSVRRLAGPITGPKAQEAVAGARGGMTAIIHCAKGVPTEPDSCNFVADAAGNGLAAYAQ